MDPIADMLTAIRNAQAAQLPTTTFSSSKLKVAILSILKKEGYIADYQQIEGSRPLISVQLKYNGRRPAISHLRRISKPGLRVYQKADNLPRPLRGIGIAVLSTPAGVITNKEARKLGVGGELLCEVW